MDTYRPLMFVGTGSDVGKSVIVAGICRILRQDGYNPAPFKSQNMSLNSYVTPEGLEIGRAQAVQAEAAGVPCHVDMNPILLKPTNDKTSQVVLLGKPLGNQTAQQYFSGKGMKELFPQAKDAFARLSSRYSPIVMEGAGSISELNLRDRDIVNMPMALAVNAAVYLIADIDKGGVFASVYGSIQLLTPEERALVKGIIINKFRGDIVLFQDGIKIIEDITGVPVLGVVPYFNDIFIEEEDSVMLRLKKVDPGKGKVNVAVVLLKHMSNFTDFNVLERDPRIHLFYTCNPDELEKASIVIIPGSKNTINDLLELRRNGCASAIIRFQELGGSVYGICGGFQMMGEHIYDPHSVEGDVPYLPGLGILPTSTTLTQEKVTRQCTFHYKSLPLPCQGYEVHMGETTPSAPSHLNRLSNGEQDGFLLNDRCWGTYIHGIFDNHCVIENILELHQTNSSTTVTDNTSFKERQYDALANLLRSSLNIDLIHEGMRPLSQE